MLIGLGPAQSGVRQVILAVLALLDNLAQAKGQTFQLVFPVNPKGSSCTALQHLVQMLTGLCPDLTAAASRLLRCGSPHKSWGSFYASGSAYGLVKCGSRE